MEISFDRGTLVLKVKTPPQSVREFFTWDERCLCWRSEARFYREIVTSLGTQQLQDKARHYEKLALESRQEITPRRHQTDALTAWINQGGRGVVSLPTGAGKTILAVLAVQHLKRPTLVVVPTIDLMQQWEQTFTKFFAEPIGLLGGGSHEVQKITVATYDSALIHIERIGHLFGFVVFDECHHLPAIQYQNIARSLIAPFRLGLSATVERADGKEEIIYDLVGPIAYEGLIHELEAQTLAPYKIVSIQVPMLPEEVTAYQMRRKVYTDFIRKNHIQMGDADGWMQFVRYASRSPEGKEAMRAYRDQKRIAQASGAKTAEVWKLLHRHRKERVIIFTDENSLAYFIGQKFFLPVLTHHTKVKERKRMLAAFRDGSLNVIVTSKVLNEGVDVPEASVGIVLSGSGAVREHVQRLGRILRHQQDKTAIMYEIVAKGTNEYFVNERRKQHYAYQRPTEVSYS